MICTAFLDFTWTSFRTNRTPGLWPWSRVSPCPKKKFHWGNQDLENLKFRVQSFRNAEKFSKYHPNNVRLTPNKFGRHISTCKCLQAAAPSEEGGAASCEPQQSLISISVNQYQSKSTNTKQYQTISINTNQYQSKYTSVKISINVY